MKFSKLQIANFTISVIVAGLFFPFSQQGLADSLADTKILSVKKQLSDLERSSGGKLGVSAFNLENMRRLQYRADERFPFCSTLKALLAAAILKKSMSDKTLLDQQVHYSKKDIQTAGFVPITEKHLEDGMSVSQLCEATLQYSDNAAANLLLRVLGGPHAVTDFIRSVGDPIFRLDRWEPELNSAVPGDLLDTSTPAAMEQSLRQLAFGDALGLSQRKQLQAWLKGNTTGDTRIRAGVPKGWIVGDKTGTGSYGTTNDIGIIWPPNRKPIILAIYFTQKEKDATPKNEVIASATRLLIHALVN